MRLCFRASVLFSWLSATASAKVDLQTAGSAPTAIPLRPPTPESEMPPRDQNAHPDPPPSSPPTRPGPRTRLQQKWLAAIDPQHNRRNTSPTAQLNILSLGWSRAKGDTYSGSQWSVASTQASTLSSWEPLPQGGPQGTRFFFWLRTALRDRPKGPPTANHQPPTATNRQPPTADHCQPPPTTNHQPPTAANHHQPPPTARRQPPIATNRQPPIATNHG